MEHDSKTPDTGLKRVKTRQKSAPEGDTLTRNLKPMKSRADTSIEVSPTSANDCVLESAAEHIHVSKGKCA